MATVTNELKLKLATDFFNTVTRVRAYGIYTTDVGPGESSAPYYSPSIDLPMNVGTSGDPNGPIAYLNEFEYFENPINLTVNAGDELIIQKLEFLNEAENTVYFEWIFGQDAVIYTGNGELHIESFDFDIQ